MGGAVAYFGSHAGPVSHVEGVALVLRIKDWHRTLIIHIDVVQASFIGPCRERQRATPTISGVRFSRNCWLQGEVSIVAEIVAFILETELR